MKRIISFFNTLEALGYRYLYEKFPRVPEAPRRLVAKFIPYAVIILILWQVYALIQYISFELVTPSAAYLYAVGGGGFGILGIMLVGMAVVLECVSLSGLFKYQRIGWLYLFWGQILIVLNDLVHLNVINFIFGGLVSMVVLFQIRAFYR